MTIAAPMPPPAHIDSTPMPPPRRRSSWMAEVTMRPENPVTLSGEDAAKMQKLLDVLEDLDDVQNVFHNAEFED